MFQSEYQTPERMAAKMQAIPLPDLRGKSVLDIGCDGGFWSALAADRGAMDVLGLDRGRESRGQFVDVVAENRAKHEGTACHFERIDLGRQWIEFGVFDVAFMFSMYHHVYAACGSHEPIWYWLSRHVGRELLWENPTGIDDGVAAKHIPEPLHAGYTRDAIMRAATKYFTVQEVGPARHTPTRVVWRCVPMVDSCRTIDGEVRCGAGGAAKAWEWEGGRRIREVKEILGVEMVPGSLNLRVDGFDWLTGYYRAQVLDVESRGSGLAQPWRPRWARFYPVRFRGMDAWAFRFETDKYPIDFVELISPYRLRPT
jgi:SAM-dependent methyltransferase